MGSSLANLSQKKDFSDCFLKRSIRIAQIKVFDWIRSNFQGNFFLRLMGSICYKWRRSFQIFEYPLLLFHKIKEFHKELSSLFEYWFIRMHLTSNFNVRSNWKFLKKNHYFIESRNQVWNIILFFPWRLIQYILWEKYGILGICQWEHLGTLIEHL
jgi:hypothetical protein